MAPPAHLGSLSIQDQKIVFRVLSPAGGAEQAKIAVTKAIKEGERIASLAYARPPPPEFAAIAGPQESLAKGLGRKPVPVPKRAWLAYAVDRGASVLQAEGMTDFLIDAGSILRAAGSQDGSHGRGWKVGVTTPERQGQAPKKSTVLHNAALAHLNRGDERDHQVHALRAPTAALAVAAAAVIEGKERPQFPELSPFGVEVVAGATAGE